MRYNQLIIPQFNTIFPMNLQNEPIMGLISEHLTSELSNLELELDTLLQKKKELLEQAKQCAKLTKKEISKDFLSRVSILRPKLPYFYAKDLAFITGRSATSYQTVMNNKTCRDFETLQELENYVLTHSVRPRNSKDAV